MQNDILYSTLRTTTIYMVYKARLQQYAMQSMIWHNTTYYMAYYYSLHGITILQLQLITMTIFHIASDQLVSIKAFNSVIKLADMRIKQETENISNVSKKKQCFYIVLLYVGACLCICVPMGLDNVFQNKLLSDPHIMLCLKSLKILLKLKTKPNTFPKIDSNDCNNY